jgi:hypothetical protein
LAPDLARQLGIQTVEVGLATGGGGQIRMFAGQVSSLAVGNAHVDNHAVGMADFLGMIGAAAGASSTVSLGTTFLVTIDYPASTLEFTSNPRL